MPTDMRKTSNTPTSHLNELLLAAIPYPKPDRPSPCVVMGYQTMSHANLTATDPLDGWKMISAKTCQSVLGARTSTGPLANLLSYRLMNASQSAPYSRLTARQLLLRFHWILGEGLHLTCEYIVSRFILFRHGDLPFRQSRSSNGRPHFWSRHQRRPLPTNLSVRDSGVPGAYRREQDLRVWIPIQNISVRI